MRVLLRRTQMILLRRVVVVILFVIFVYDALCFHRYGYTMRASPSLIPPSTRWNTTVFIASTHWNNEAILREYWNDAVINLVDYFGTQNTFVSIYESGSWDNSKEVLKDLRDRLEARAVHHNIVLDPTTHSDEISRTPEREGWIDTPRNKRELRRIPYLSKLRNLSLAPLRQLVDNGIMIDKILFLNDVVFTTEDVVELLRTNQGQFAGACSLDFSKPPAFYDTFALRDSEGHEALMSTWPYFRSAISRDAIKRQQPVPVSSCWNGMVLMDASPFVQRHTPLQFRAIPDSLAELHLEGSECCLIHQDNPLSQEHGVFVNPKVRVGYSKQAYNTARKDPTFFQFLWWSAQNRFYRWFTTDWFKVRTVSARLNVWQTQHKPLVEAGVHCLINEMQVLVANGWAHV